LLILAAATPHDHSERIARANQLSFPEVRSLLRTNGETDLDSLHKRLERDFAIIAELLKVTPVADFDFGLEHAMLAIHYRTMSACFHLTSRTVRDSASDALEEMSLVVRHLANEVGARCIQEHR
jgi:hypothetical protein